MKRNASIELVVVLVTTLALVPSPAQAQFSAPEVTSYSKAVHGGGTIAVTHVEDEIEIFEITTDLGTLKGEIGTDAGAQTYFLAITGSNEFITMDLAIDEHGVAFGTINYTPGGTIGYVFDETAEPNLQASGSIAADCDVLVGSDIYAAVLQAQVATETVAFAYNATYNTRKLLVPIYVVLQIVASMPASVEGDCEPMVPSWFYGMCPDMMNEAQCVSCCEDATEVTTMAIGIQCALSGPLGGVACIVALVLSMEEDVKRHFSRDRHALASGVDPRIWQCLTFGRFPLRQFRL